MALRDELGIRMKNFYESVPKTKLLRRTPVAIRIDGKAFHSFTRDEKSRTFSSNSKISYILRTSSRSIRLILSSIVSLAVSLKWTRTI